MARLTGGPGGRGYQVAPGMGWLVQADGVLVWDELAGTSRTLDPVCSVIWESLLSGRMPEEAAIMTARVCRREPDDMVAVVREQLDRWLSAGWLIELPGSRAGG